MSKGQKVIENQKLSFDQLYKEISQNWESKAKQLQDRRWHHIHKLPS